MNSFPSKEMEQTTGCSATGLPEAQAEIPDLIVIGSENNSPIQSEKNAKRKYGSRIKRNRSVETPWGEPATTQETSDGVAKYMDRAAKEMKHSFRVFKHSRDAITYICASMSIDEFNSRMFRYGRRPEAHHCMFCMHWTFHVDGNYPRIMSDFNLVMFFSLSSRKMLVLQSMAHFGRLSPRRIRDLFGRA